MGKSLSEQAASKPYQGVRVKDPVKELLRRKRGNTDKAVPPTAVAFPNNTLPSFAHVGSSVFTGNSQNVLNESAVDVGALCPSWVAQSSGTATFQPLGHWAPPEYFQHDQSLSTLPSLKSDMFVQPVCPSYAVVHPSSVLTLAHTPLFTSLGTISSSSSGLPQIDVQDGSLAYIPWAPPMSSCQHNVAPHLLPIPVSEAQPQQEEPATSSEGTLALEKLLEDKHEDPKEAYNCGPSLFTQDI